MGLFASLWYEAISAPAVEQGGQIGLRRSCVEQRSWTCAIVCGRNEWFLNRQIEKKKSCVPLFEGDG